MKCNFRVVFRVDASKTMGTGHLVRCLTLGSGLKEQGAEVSFITRLNDNYFSQLIEQQGFNLFVLEAQHNDFVDEGYPPHAVWLGEAWDVDAAQTIDVMSSFNSKVNWLVVDHYAIEERWHKSVRPYIDRIMVIDDIADRVHDCDLLLDQNYYQDMALRYANKVPSHCSLLFGPQYALLRKSFERLCKQSKPRIGPVKKILIFFGGVDSDNLTEISIHALWQLERRDLSVDVVIGALHPKRDNIRELCCKYDFKCHIQTNKMAELMSKADLAIGAGGSASWERCCLGLPCLTVAVAKNQIQAAKDLSNSGAIKLIGEVGEITLNKLRSEIKKVLNSSWINKASKIGLSLVDAQGVKRIIETMVKL